MKLIHYSNAASVVVESRKQTDRMKPTGLWVSDEDDYGWSTWCTEEEFGIGANAFAVTLADDANVLTLSTPDEIRAFHVQVSRGRYDVDWAAVARRWQGILITPYQWSLRLSDVDWYYPWDCASGCIWDAQAIASVAPIAAVLSEGGQR